jgi:sugar phosphate isomerase/epimerase
MATPPLNRRDALLAALAAGTAAALPAAAETPRPDARRVSPKRHDMKKSINLWAFPYLDGRMTLRECLQLAKDAGFDGIELNYDEKSDLSPKAGVKELRAIRKTAADIGIAISGLCSFLFWPYSLTSNNVAERKRGALLAGKMLEAAAELGTTNLLVVPGAVHIPWIKDHDPVPLEVCDKRAREAVARMVPRAEKLGVYLNIENIFFNGYLLSAQDMIAFVDSFKSKHVRVHFDTGNIMLLSLTNLLDCGRILLCPNRRFCNAATGLLLPAFLVADSGGRRQHSSPDGACRGLVQAQRLHPGQIAPLHRQGQERLPRSAPPRGGRPAPLSRRGRGRPHPARQRVAHREHGPAVA